jgi:nucleoside-diphosphate-sugar epimerase
MRIVVIGGTHFVGRAAVEDAVARGHEVTVFHRGKEEPEGFPDVEHVHGDRDGGLGALAGRSWDVALDTSAYVPRQVREVVEVLGDAVGRYGYISTLSVYPDDAPRGATEDTPTHAPPWPQTEDVTDGSYGPLKAACEEAALAGFPGRTLIVRPGYIVGPHDPTDRFTCWVRRAAAGGRMLAPGPRDQPLQVVDVRDLGAFTLDHLEAGTTDVFGVVGPGAPLTWGEALPAIVAAVGAETELVWAPRDYLEDALGEDRYQALPLWDVEFPGLHAFDASKAVAAGLRHRPFAQTVADTLAWDREHGRPKAGLDAGREAELLAGLPG